MSDLHSDAPGPLASSNSSSLYGPAELVAWLVDVREAARKMATGAYGSITEAGLSHLVHLAYYTSQTVEEGKFPKFRLFVAPDNNIPPTLQHPLRLLKFQSPVPLREVDDLRRLAPCASAHDFALEVEEVPNGESRELRCVGVRMAHSGEGGPELLSSSIWARHVPSGLIIRVDGPGQLRVSEAGRAYDLRGGELLDLGGLPSHPIQKWADQLANRLSGKYGRENQISHALQFAWNELIHDASLRGRGGCLIIIPVQHASTEEVKEDFGIQLKYPTSDLCIGDRIGEFVHSCFPKKGQMEGEEQFKEVANSWLRRRFGIAQMISSVSHIAGVDGCTVFDADLCLIGFGGKIQSREPQRQKRFKDFRTNQFLSEDVLKRIGTRHLSAFQLCKANDGVTAYVISQDGHVTLFWSDQETVYRWAPYWPWAKRSDHF